MQVPGREYANTAVLWGSGGAGYHRLLAVQRDAGPATVLSNCERGGGKGVKRGAEVNGDYVTRRTKKKTRRKPIGRGAL